MRTYERQESGRRLLPMLPVLGRVDGRAFHRLTRNMERPFDSSFRRCMELTMLRVCEETNALLGYTQSDEITFVWYAPNPKSQIWFDGRIAKMTSQLAAQTTLWFDRNATTVFGTSVTCMNPTFDARVWVVPAETEAANVFLWREQDAVRNSISMAAQQFYSHRELFGKSSNQMQEMLFEKGINWNDYPAEYKRGVYCQRQLVTRRFTAEELDKLPVRHEARRNPDLVVERSVFRSLTFPPFGSVVNREDVVLRGAEPETAKRI